MEALPEKVEAIYAAALPLFVAQGIQGTSTASIAKAAGVSNGTLFHYFSTKEALVLALYRHLKLALAEQTPTPSAANSPLAQIEQVLLSVIHWAMAHPDGYRYLRMVSQPPFSALLTPEDHALGFSAHMALLQAGQAAGQVAAGPTHLLYALLSAQVDALLAVLEQFPEAQDTLIAFALQRMRASLQ
jgi:AcrR family transcriptional regulator